MRLPTLPLSLISLLSLTSAMPTPHASKPAYFLLAGDSTTAPAGGWGDAFLSTTLLPPASGHNYAKSGASTASFRAEGIWAAVVKDVGTYAKDHAVYVTIQFGHNDQKPKSGVSMDMYRENLRAFAGEVKGQGGVPILVTPLTRRNFNASTSRVIENLAAERAATIDVAQKNGIRFIDLNLASENYVNAIGKTASSKYNLAPDDWTHLNEYGGVVFARIVSDLLAKKFEDVRAVTKKNETMSRAIREGRAV